MNYKFHYDALIDKAKRRGKTCEFTESHHIIPRCLRGSDDAENLVDLYPREHYVAHLLLAKINPDVNGLWFAVHMMANTKNKNMRLTNKTYQWVKDQYVLRIATTNKNKQAVKYGFNSYWEQVKSIWNLFESERISANRISKKLAIPSANVCRCLNDYMLMFPESVDLYDEIQFEIKSYNSKQTRANIKPESEKRRLDAVRAVDYTERNLKLSGDRLGINNPNFGNKTSKSKTTCPHCGFTGGTGGIHRWHFDNCKRIKNES